MCDIVCSMTDADLVDRMRCCSNNIFSIYIIWKYCKFFVYQYTEKQKLRLVQFLMPSTKSPSIIDPTTTDPTTYPVASIEYGISVYLFYIFFFFVFLYCCIDCSRFKSYQWYYISIFFLCYYLIKRDYLNFFNKTESWSWFLVIYVL